IIIAEPNLLDIFRRGKILLYVSAFCAFYLITFLTIWLRTRWVRTAVYRVMLLSCRTGILSPERFRRWYRKVSREIRRFVYGFGRFTGGPALHVFLSVLFTVVFLLALFSFSVVLIRALGYSVPTWSILAFQVVVTFFMYFAPTPGAAGVAEGGYGLLFATLLQKRDLAMLTLLWRFLTIYIGVLVGLLIIYREIFARGKAVEP
ncbi:MAG: flippase-like domain-containing protein, partial [bacterium]